MKKSRKIIDDVVENILFICTVGFVMMSFSQVIFRYVLNNSISWAEEFCRYLFVWTVFFGSAVGFLHKKHIGIDLLKKFIPEKYEKYYALFINFIVIVFLIFLTKVGYGFAMRSFDQPSPAMQIPIGYIYMAVPLGSIVMVIYVIRETLFEFSLGKEEE